MPTWATQDDVFAHVDAVPDLARWSIFGPFPTRVSPIEARRFADVAPISTSSSMTPCGLRGFFLVPFPRPDVAEAVRPRTAPRGCGTRHPMTVPGRG